VCGKGVTAASLTGLVRYTARAAAIGDTQPTEVLQVVNEAVLREPGDDQICTMAYVRVDISDGTTTVTSAAGGHPLPLVVRADGRVEALGRPGTLLGAFETVDALDAATALSPGDALVLYTDGVTEARTGAEFFGTDRLLALLADVAGASAEDMVTRITDAALDFQGGHPRDDIAVVVIRVPDE
jgi:sigma-B regulation protein RsbU (phosphoserine phosphatase)